MRWIIVLGLVLLPLVTWGNRGQFTVTEGKKTVVCAPVHDVLEFLSSEFEEQEQWRGLGSDSVTSLWHNPDTGSWTVVEFDQNMACLLATGTRSQTVQNLRI